MYDTTFHAEKRNISFAICDDNAEEIETISGLTASYCTDRKIPFSIAKYLSMDALLNSRTYCDLILLDVMMPGLNGLEGAAMLNQRKVATPVVFITSMLEAAVDSYRVNAAGFLLKPVTRTAFDDTVSRVLDKYLSVRDNLLQISCNQIPLHVSVSRIRHLESRLHQVLIYLQDAPPIRLNAKLDDLAKQIPARVHYIRCHKSYLVNPAFVSDMDNHSFKMDDGTHIPISRAKLKEAKTAWYLSRLGDL